MPDRPEPPEQPPGGEWSALIPQERSEGEPVSTKQHRGVHRERFSAMVWCRQAAARLAFGAAGGAAAAAALAQR